MNRSEKFKTFVAQTSLDPLMLEINSASGCFLHTTERSILDFISGISVSNLGHSNPAVMSAVKKQIENFSHLMVYGEFALEPQIALAQKIISLLPSHLNNVFFTNSGSEAIEGAMKLSKRFTGRSEFVALENAYHGSTQGALSLMSNSYYAQKYRPLLPGIKFMRQNFLEDIQKISGQTAAVFIEPVMGEAGYLTCNREFLVQVKKRCCEVGALLVFDEIQTGFGRTGKFLASDTFQIYPDILVLGKALGGGFPLGAFIAEKEIMSVLSENPVLGHITTFGGHPVSCAAALASLNSLIDELWINSVEYKSELLKSYLNHAVIKGVNGTGLMLGVEFESEKVAKEVVLQLLKKGILTDWFLYNGASLRLAPPLIITNDLIDMFGLTFAQIINEIS